MKCFVVRVSCKSLVRHEIQRSQDVKCSGGRLKRGGACKTIKNLLLQHGFGSEE